jgi:pimeloyl-ACP methyl ester carboxylesterase
MRVTPWQSGCLQYKEQNSEFRNQKFIRYSCGVKTFPSVYLFHGKGGSPNGTVSLLEAAFVDLFHGVQFVRPELPHHDPELPAERSLPYVEHLNIPKNSLIIGVSLGGIVAARVQELSRPDLHVICISSPTWADAVTLEKKMANRLSLYSSFDDVIAGRTATWPDLAEAYDLPWLTHQTDAHIPNLRELVGAYVRDEHLGGAAASLT